MTIRDGSMMPSLKWWGGASAATTSVMIKLRWCSSDGTLPPICDGASSVQREPTTQFGLFGFPGLTLTFGVAPTLF
jgi:hypothetical protein